MTATYHTIACAPRFAPDAKAVCRIASGSGYRFYYVDGKRDARAVCRAIGAQREGF